MPTPKPVAPSGPNPRASGRPSSRSSRTALRRSPVRSPRSPSKRSPARRAGSGRTLGSTASSGAASPRRVSVSSRSQVSTSSSTRALFSQQPIAKLIDVFLADAKAMGDRVPTNEELDKARHFLRHLEATTREDHLKSIDEVLAHAPRELLLKTRQLQEAETFVLLSAAGNHEKMRRKLDGDWELVNATDRDGHTALHAAAACNNVATVELLIARGAHAGLQDYEGYLPLHWAAENDALEVAAVLVKHTENMHLKNSAGMTVMDYVTKGSSTPERRGAWLELLKHARDKESEEVERRRDSLFGTASSVHTR